MPASKKEEQPQIIPAILSKLELSSCESRYLVDQPIENLQTDNGSEFAWEFETATAKLGIQSYFSRVKTPKDNTEIERFNETLEYE